MITKEKFLTYLNDLSTIDEMDRKLNWFGFTVSAGAPSIKYYRLLDDLIYGGKEHYNVIAYWIDMGRKGEKVLAAGIRNDDGSVEYAGFRTPEELYDLIVLGETHAIVGVYGIDENGNVILPREEVPQQPVEETPAPVAEETTESETPCISQVQIG